MNNIVVVGCGNIGSRLIQSLSNINSDKCGHYNIFGVEPFPQAWPTVQDRFEQENKGGHRLTLVEGPMSLPERRRFDGFCYGCPQPFGCALTDALAVCRPKNILLEKILFTKAADYAIAADLIAKTGAKCWVNTSRNIWPGYQALKTELSDNNITNFTVSGSDWGLGCNAIHFLSAYEYISGDEIVELKLELGSVELQESKRAGYRELTGRLVGKSANGAIISIESLAAPNTPISVAVQTNAGNYLINEGGQKIIKPTGADTEVPFGLLYTSQLHNMFETILMTGSSDLPTLENSTRLHLLLISSLNEAFHGDATLAYECPIT